MDINTNISSTEDLRTLLQMINYLPSATWTGSPVYCLVPIEMWDLPCDEELGNPEKTMAQQYYEVARNETHVCTKTANSLTHVTADGEIPNGNYSETCFDEEVFKAWIEKFGIDAFYVENPIEVIEDVI